MLRRQPVRRPPKTIILFDTETHLLPKPFGIVQQYLRLGWVVVWRRAVRGRKESFTWHPFRQVAEFWAIVEAALEPKGTTGLCSLNILFDLCIVGGFDRLRPHNGYFREFVHAKAGSFLAKFERGKGKLVVFDVVNLFRCSARRLGELLGLPKGDVDFRSVADKELSVYCRRDTEIILDAMREYIKFVTGNDLGGWAYTIASQAMRAFRHRYMEHPIFLHDRTEVLALERAAYTGGRVECFRLGHLTAGPYWKLDVNSMYAAVMATESVPRSLRALQSGLSLAELRKLITKYAVVAEVIVETPDPVYAVRYNQRVICPVGRFGAVLTTPELKYALAQGHVKRVGRVATYRTAPLFKTFAKELYKLRRGLERAGNALHAHVCKFLLNSLSGKWGQLCETWTPVAGKVNEPPTMYEEFNYQEQRIITHRSLFGLTETSGPELESRDSFTAIIAHITAGARMKLWELIQRAGRENVTYCDTDSLIVNREGLGRLKGAISATRLGGLKIEYQTQELYLYAPKDYKTDTETRIKGVPRKTAQNDDGSFTVEIWPGLAGVLRRGAPPGYRTYKIRKHLARSYSKGHDLGDGSVIPFTLSGELYPSAFDLVGRASLWGAAPETSPSVILTCHEAYPTLGLFLFKATSVQ